MKKDLPETLPFLTKCLVLGFCFLCCFTTGVYADNTKHTAGETASKNAGLDAVLQGRVCSVRFLGNFEEKTGFLSLKT